MVDDHRQSASEQRNTETHTTWHSHQTSGIMLEISEPMWGNRVGRLRAINTAGVPQTRNVSGERSSPATVAQKLLMAIQILTGCCQSHLAALADESVHTCVTSPPYWGLRDYGHAAQLGLEPTPDEFVRNLVAVFREVKRVLRDDGTLWLNLGDSYANGGCGTRDEKRWPKQSRNDHMPAHAKKQTGVKTKDLIGVPWRVAFALQEDGWFLRSDIIWHKTNPMPESVCDRPTKAHEYLFLLSKFERYFYDSNAIREPRVQRSIVSLPTTNRTHTLLGRNKRTVWTMPTQPFSQAHFATFPPKLIEPCILAGCPAGGTVLDPFFGAGTTGLVADRLGRHCVGIELNPEYVAIAEERLRRDAGMFADVVVAA